MKQNKNSVGTLVITGGDTARTSRYVSQAEKAAVRAEQSAAAAEAWAVGESGGIPVGSTDETFHNNARHFAEHAAGSAASAQIARTAAESAANAAQSAKDDAEAAAQSVAGSAAQIQSNKQDTDDLKSAINDLGTTVKRKNIFDKTALTTGYYYTQSGQGGGGSAGYAIYPVLKLEAGVHYCSSSSVMRSAFTYYSSAPTGTRTALSSISDAGIISDATYIKLNNYAPAFDMYLFITVGTPDDINNFMLVNDSSLPSTYKAYNVVYRTDVYGEISSYLKKNQGVENKGKRLIVGDDGEVVPQIDATEEIYFADYNYQYIDHTKLEKGYFTASGSSIVNHPGNNDYYNCVVLGLGAGTYYFKSIKSDFTFAKTVSGIINFTQESGNITVNDTFDLYITTTRTGVDTVMFANDVLPRFYVYGRYNITLAENAFKGDIGNCVYVEKDGSGDFTTIVEAVAYAQTHKNITIYIGPGTYDIIDELGSDYINSVSSTSGRAGIALGNGMHLVFSSNSKVVSHYSGQNQYMYSMYSPFNNMADNEPGFIIENLVLECSNCRYGIHDETSGHAARYKNEYRNCRIILDNRENTHWAARQCIGGGLGRNSEIVVDGCYFESKTYSETGTGIVSYHNTTGSSASDNIRSNIIIKNSYFAGLDTVKVSYLGPQTEKSTALVSGCSLGSAPYVQDEGTGSAINMELYTAANEIRQ